MRELAGVRRGWRISSWERGVGVEGDAGMAAGGLMGLARRHDKIGLRWSAVFLHDGVLEWLRLFCECSDDSEEGVGVSIGGCHRGDRLGWSGSFDFAQDERGGGGRAVDSCLRRNDGLGMQE